MTNDFKCDIFVSEIEIGEIYLLCFYVGVTLGIARRQVATVYERRNYYVAFTGQTFADNYEASFEARS